MQLCASSNISGQNLPVSEQVYAFQLAVGWGTAGGGGDVGHFAFLVTESMAAYLTPGQWDTDR